MLNIRVANSKDRFTANGAPWFYLADTIWSAFSNVSDAEWKEYLDYRRMQGFNALQINMLTVWDAGASELDLYPFERDASGRFLFDKINARYFERAAGMLKTATEMGFVPSLALLWANYVPGTWASRDHPGTVMTMPQMERYAEFAVKAFAPFKPIYMASGDTDFLAPESVAYYRRGMELIRKFSPDSLISMHLSPSADVPEELVHSDLMDFYMYQSCHHFTHLKNPYLLAEKFRAISVKRPLVNSEPCYEGHNMGPEHGLCSAFQVRRAVWQSLLSGAKAGITYGAQGVWGWYRDGKPFLNESFGGRPVPWRRALQFPGAWDMSYMRWIFESHGLVDLEPSSLVRNATAEIRLSVSPDGNRFALYAPFNAAYEIGMDLTDFDVVSIELENRRVVRPAIASGREKSIIRQHDFNADVLVVGRKK